MTSQEIQQTHRSKPRFFYGNIVVVAAFFIMAAMSGLHFAFGVFFKPMLNEFGWTRAITSGAISLNMITQGFLGIVMGGLTDRFGPRVVLTICGFLLGLGYLLVSQTSTLWQLYLFYGVIAATGMSGAIVPLVTTVARWFVKSRSTMTGIVLSGIGIGTLIVPPVASRLISIYDWRTSYLILGGLSSMVVILAAQFLKRDPTTVGQVPYAETGGEEPRSKLRIEGFSLKQAVCTRQFWLVSAVFFSLGFSRLSIMVHIAPHAIEMGISATEAANILATIGGLSIIGRIVMGAAADKIGNRLAFIIGFILMSAALFWLVQATETWMLYLFAAVFGLFSFGVAASESPLVAGLFGLSYHGLIFGILGFIYTIGAAIGPLLAGYLFDVAGNYQASFLVSAAVGIIGLIVIILLTPTKTN